MPGADSFESKVLSLSSATPLNALVSRHIHVARLVHSDGAWVLSYWKAQLHCFTGDPLQSRAACTQPCNVNTHSRAYCSPGARLCEQWGHGCVNNGARLCASARLCRGSPVCLPCLEARILQGPTLRHAHIPMACRSCLRAHKLLWLPVRQGKWFFSLGMYLFSQQCT